VKNFEKFIFIFVSIKFSSALKHANELPSPCHTRRFTYPVDRGFIDAEVPGAKATRTGLLGRANLETLFLSVENNVLRSSALVRAYISLFMLLAGEGRASFWRFLSRSGNSVLSPSKKGSRARTMVFRSQRSAMFFQHRRRRRHPPRGLFPLLTPVLYFSILRLEFARPYLSHVPPVQLSRPPPLFPSYYFSSFFLATSAGTLTLLLFIAVALLPPVLLQPRKSKLDAKTRPNVHNAQSPTYRVSGTIAGGHRFPPPGRDKCEDMLPENARRLVPRLPCSINLDRS